MQKPQIGAFKCLTEITAHLSIWNQVNANNNDFYGGF
jgi:hypothetical protein